MKTLWVRCTVCLVVLVLSLGLATTVVAAPSADASDTSAIVEEAARGTADVSAAIDVDG